MKVPLKGIARAHSLERRYTLKMIHFKSELFQRRIKVAWIKLMCRKLHEQCSNYKNLIAVLQ